MHTNYRILYIGTCWDGATCKMRCDILKELGHQVTIIDTHNVISQKLPTKLYHRILNRLGYPSDISCAYTKILHNISVNKYDIVWVDDVRLISRQLLIKLKKQSPETILLSFIMDNPFSSRLFYWQRFFSAIPYYDIHFVIRDEDIIKLYKHRAKRVSRYHKGYAPQTHKPMDLPSDSHFFDVFFTGHHEQIREEYIAHLLEANIPITVSGHRDWQKGSHWKTIKPHFIDGGFYATDYTEVLNKSNIALCFYSQFNKDTENSRMYEIPACGTFMLAERNNENISIFKEGKEAEFFSSPEELLKKVRYYLAHADERIQIAKAGRNRCIKSGYSYSNRLTQILNEATGTYHHN